MASHSFTTKARLVTSMKLVTLLKIIVHIPISERAELFEEIRKNFEKKDKKYKDALNYFQRNWLNEYYVESMIEETETTTSISRTNNICEYYNYLLNQKLNMVSPRISILISSLLNEEYIIREFLMKASFNTMQAPPLPRGFTVEEENMPIGSLNRLIEERKSRSAYNLRSISDDKEFQIECRRLVSRSYQILFLASEENEDFFEEQKVGESNSEDAIDKDFTDLFCTMLQQEKEEFEDFNIQEQINNEFASKSKRYLFLLKLNFIL